MSDHPSLPSADLPAGTVRRLGRWALLRRTAPSGSEAGEALQVTAHEPEAVSARCRHQLADLSKGSIDADGCLVCPWHQSRYDVTTGAMVSGPKGFLGYHGPAPGYAAAVLALGRVAKLRVGRVTEADGAITVDRP